jgi:ribosomal protein S18 acetylase RimI-like enzyme
MTPAAPTTPLDNPIWSALTSQQQALAQGGAHARRFPGELARFAGMPGTAPVHFAALEQLLCGDELLALFTAAALAPPPAFQIEIRNTLDQMMGPRTPDALGPTGTPDGAPMIELGAADVDEMMALVELSKPGPFGVRTHELGRYLGVRCHGRLVAMAGERLHLDGHTEISAVCVHPEQRGRGYPRALIATLSQAILARGETPFLHVFGDNLAALALYRKLGFTRRATLHLTVLRRA